MLSLLLAAAAMSTALPPHPGEDPVAPYAVSNANAGADPFQGGKMWDAFHRADGVDRIVDDFVARNRADPRISDIFKGQDFVRLRRVLKEQFCYILGGGCAYTGRDMHAAHKDMGLQNADMGALVENLQRAMDREKVAFAAQNRFLAKLAPMRPNIVER